MIKLAGFHFCVVAGVALVIGCAAAIPQSSVGVSATPSPNLVVSNSPFPSVQPIQHPRVTAAPSIIRVGQLLTINGTGFTGKSVKLWIVPFYNFRNLPGEPTPPGPDAGSLGEATVTDGSFNFTATLQASYSPTPNNGTLKLSPSTFQIWAKDDQGKLEAGYINLVE
jgi:hypothetical protein